MKNNLKIAGVSALAAVSMLMTTGYSAPALAFASNDEVVASQDDQAQQDDQLDQYGRQRRGRHQHGKGRHGKRFARRAFGLGLCVGQTLAKDGVYLPKRQPGQRTEIDAATKEKFKAAIKECKAQFPKRGKGSQKDADQTDVNEVELF